MCIKNGAAPPAGNIDIDPHHESAPILPPLHPKIKDQESVIFE